MSDESEMFDGVGEYVDDDYSLRALCLEDNSDLIGRDDINRLSLRITRDPEVLHDFLDSGVSSELNIAKRLLRPDKTEKIFLASRGYRIAELNGQWYAYNSEKNDLLVFNGAFFQRTNMILDPDGEHGSVHLAAMFHNVSGSYGLPGRCRIV